jgi:hypothetical protein
MKVKLVESTMIIKRGGEDMEVYVDGYVHSSKDVLFGADADGHRGISRVLVEKTDGVMASTMSGESVILTEIEYEAASDLLTETFLQN